MIDTDVYIVILQELMQLYYFIYSGSLYGISLYNRPSHRLTVVLTVLYP